MDIEPIKDIKELKEAISEIQKMESKNGKKAESRRWWIPIAQGILDAYKLKQAKGRAEDMDIESAEERWWKPIAHTVISLLGRAGDAAEENEEENFMDIEPIKDIKELKEAISEIQKMESKNGKKAESRRWWIPIAQGILDAYKLKQAKGRAGDMDIESAEERWWKPLAHSVISFLGRAGDAAEEEHFMDIEPIKDMKELKEAVSEIQKMESKNGNKAESRRWWIPIAQGVLTALGRSAEVDEIIDVAENREDNMLAIQPIHNKKELDAALKLIQKMESNQDRSLAESRRWWIPIAQGVLSALGRSEEIDEPAEERRWWLPIAQGLLDAYKLKSAKGRAVDDADDNEEENFMDIEPIKDMNELKEAVSEVLKMESKNGKKAESRRWWIPIAQGVLTALG